MHSFHLGSLVVHRYGDPQVIDIDPDDYALATSPALYSVVAKVRNYETEGELNYNEDAIRGMVAGAAPNLQHVWLMDIRCGDSLPFRAAVALGKPSAPPDRLFFPKVQAGSQRSLLFLTAKRRDINAWTARTDFSKLCYLAVPWDPALVDMAAHGELASLRGLCLDEIDMESNSAVCQLLTALSSNSLRDLLVGGHIKEVFFDTLLERHGKSLRHLVVKSWPHYDMDEYEEYPPPPPVFLTPALAARLAEKCPNLEQVGLDVDRSLGDARECAVYRGLGRLPRLRRLSLNLWFTVSAIDDALNENDDSGWECGRVPRACLSQAFANAAVDANLARAIFDMSSPGGGLQYLELQTWRKMGFHTIPVNDGQLYNILEWFSRDWICERRRSGDNISVAEVRERGSGATKQAAEEWQYLAETSEHRGGEEVFVQAFGDVWPQTTPRWWEDWKSMPLCPDDGRTE